MSELERQLLTALEQLTKQQQEQNRKAAERMTQHEDETRKLAGQVDILLNQIGSLTRQLDGLSEILERL